MWVLGKFLLILIMAAAGLTLLSSLLPPQRALPDDSPPALQWVQMRTLGSITVLCVAIYLYRKLGQLRDRQLQRDIALTVQALRRGLPFEAGQRYLWPFGLLALLTLMGAGGIFVLNKGRWELAAGCLGLLPLLAWSGWPQLRQLLRRDPMLRIDRHGLHYTPYGASIPWSDVLGIQLHRVQWRYMTWHVLNLGVRNAAPHLRGAPPLIRWGLWRRSRKSGEVAPLPIQLEYIDAAPELIHRAAMELRQQHDAPFLHDWHPLMDSADIDAGLRVNALNKEIGEVDALMPSLPDNPTSAQIETFEIRGREYLKRQQALLPVLDMQLRAQAARDRRVLRRVWWGLLPVALLWIFLLALMFFS